MWPRVFGSVVVVLYLVPGVLAETRSQRVTAAAGAEADEWADRIAGMHARGDLALRQARADTLLPGRTHERFTQLHKGVPVFGGELVRQSAGGATVSVFGRLYEDIDVDPLPVLSAAEAQGAVERLAGVTLGPRNLAELYVLPHPEGRYVLAYRVRAMSEQDLRVYFISAHTGAAVWDYSDLKTQAAVGTGRGVLEDRKKISTRSVSGAFVADDELRPPSIVTHDLKGNLFRVIDFLNGFAPLGSGDLARDTDNDWSDGAAVDAHVYAGWTYDYYFKRFGRRGLDNANIRILSVVHPVNRSDLFSYPAGIVGAFYINAFYAGNGVMVYGEGLPSNLRLGGKAFNYFAGALDIVAHELSHGVLDFSSRLIYFQESGALNESFADVMATGVEFFFQPAGNGLLQADYLAGEDVVTPGGGRSLANPAAFGDPDHYSRRFTGTADNGGVHINSSIPNHAYYLAIEGGINRTSGLSVTGVGSANREQIEKVFYRGLALMLPPSADFHTAREATIVAARDLYGAGSAAETAVRQAWTAVGVN